MRQRNTAVALVVASCLGLAGCAVKDEAPVLAESPSGATTAEPSPSPTQEHTQPSEPSSQPPADPPSPSPDTPAATPSERAPEGSAEPPYRRPLPRPSNPAPTTPGPSTSPTGPAQPSTPPAHPSPPREVGGPSEALPFGQTYVWANGLAITAGRPTERALAEGDQGEQGVPPEGNEPAVGTPAPKVTTEHAGTAGSTGATVEPTDPEARTTSTAPPTPSVVTVDLVIFNGTDEPVNTSFFVAMTSAGADAPAVYDTTAGLTGPPGTMLQPGGTVRFTMGFEAKDPTDLTLEVRPAYHYVSAVFVRTAGAQG